MNQITIAYEDLFEQLKSVSNDVELVTPDGRRLGMFRPESKRPISGPVSLDEIYKRTTHPGGQSTAEVLEHLNRL